jgi:2-C-methyl-D-erythritol 4-phosphate cytidylyltransferase
MARAWAVVPAAGSGRRMGADVAKQYLPLRGRPLLAHALAPLFACARIEAVVLVVAPGDTRWAEVIPPGPRLLTADGGAERCHSVLQRPGPPRGPRRPRRLGAGARRRAALPVGRGARALFAALAHDPVGGLLAVPLADTLKAADESGRVSRTLPRDGLWRALTPQMFRYGLLRKSLAEAIAAGVVVTDEAAAIELAGHRPALVAGRTANLKVTGPEDLALAEAVLRRREER